ncbi:MAG: metallophosphoesterase family protein [Candidatus Hydrogenedentota bacterium]
MKRVMVALFVLLALAATAVARHDDGTLGLIVRPHNGLPALCTNGGAFEVTAQEQAALSLVDAQGRTTPLEPDWTQRPGAPWRATVPVPARMAPGVYALQAVHDAGRDQNGRAVYVFDAMPETYAIAHLTDTHIGSSRHPRTAAAIMRDLAAAINASAAAFAVITGDVTDQGTPAQFRMFLELLDTCTLPTFVLPGNHDRNALHYERFFGPVTYHFRFGADGYLAFDTKDYFMADEMGPQDGALQRYRRDLKAVRWCVGLTHRYVQMMGMRSQLTLFADNPLDALLFGHYHDGEPPPHAQSPWDSTRMVATPAAVDGYVRYVDVAARGIQPRQPERPAPIE